MLAAVLLLGNVQFVDSGGVEVSVKGDTELNAVAGLLGVTSAALFRGITSRTHNARGQLVKSLCDANMVNIISLSLFSLEICLQDVVAVSYTHLDVYKRQNVCRIPR